MHEIGGACVGGGGGGGRVTGTGGRVGGGGGGGVCLTVQHTSFVGWHCWKLKKKNILLAYGGIQEYIYLILDRDGPPK